MAAVETSDEYIKCNLCESDDTARLFLLKVPEHHVGRFSHNEWNIVRCRRVV